jgi:ribosomal protein L12E/L44/L45/RPP1/RPP2
LIKAAKIEDVEPICTVLFAKALEGKDVKELLVGFPSGSTVLVRHPAASPTMKHLAAYLLLGLGGNIAPSAAFLLLGLGGNASPSAADVKVDSLAVSKYVGC